MKDMWHYDNVKAMPRGSPLMDVLDVRMADPKQREIRDNLFFAETDDSSTGGRGCVLSGRVLEIGTGTGALLRWMVEVNGANITEAVGLDPSPAMLERAAAACKSGPLADACTVTTAYTTPGYGGHGSALADPEEGRSHATRVRFVEGSAVDLSQCGDAGSFDHVVLWTCLSHIPLARHAAVFNEIKRVLKADGVLHVFDNDMCAREVVSTLGAGDCLATAYKHYLSHVVYPDTQYLMRSLPGDLCNRYHFSTAARVAPLRLDTVVYTTAHSETDPGTPNYGYNNLLRALDGYGKWAGDRVGPAFVDALKAEAARRAARGELVLAFGYAYLRARPAVAVAPVEGDAAGQ